MAINVGLKRLKESEFPVLTNVIGLAIALNQVKRIKHEDYETEIQLQRFPLAITKNYTASRV